MARDAAPVALTGGGGFEYESYVASLFLMHMLRGTSPFGESFGTIKKLQWQARDKGWLIDDILLESQQSKAAVSIKSERQLTSSGFPEDFVKDAWELWLARQTGPFDPDRDLLVLVVAKLANEVHDAWNMLLNQIQATDVDRMLERIATKGMVSSTAKAMFDSFACPLTDAPKRDLSPLAQLQLLRSVRVMHLDFLDSPSRSQTDAISMLRQVVADGTDSSAQTLWQLLCNYSQEQRASGGTGDLARVFRITGLPSLTVHPDYQRAWEKLSQIAEMALNQINTALGNQVSALRLELSDQIGRTLLQHKIAVLTGPSGVGKSAFAKAFALKEEFAGNTLWLSPAILAQSQNRGLEPALEIDCKLVELIRDFSGERGLVVVDATDRLDASAIEIAAHVVASAMSNPKWHILVTATPDGWRQFTGTIGKLAIEIPSSCVLSLPPLKQEEVASVLRAFPKLTYLASRQELNPLIGNAKILDWIIDASEQAESATTLARIGLPTVASWVWDRWIRTGPTRHARSEFLKRLAGLEGQTFRSGAPISLLTDHAVLGELEDAKLLTVEFEQVRFSHDLVGDWSRLYILIESASDAPKRIGEVATFPRWQQAIQLFGQWKLESSSGSIDEWLALLNAVEVGREGRLCEGILLESLFTASNAEVLLNSAWPVLIQAKGVRLRKLLELFLHAATYPDPRIEQVLDEISDPSYLRSAVRLPDWLYWLPMLKVLSRHSSDAVRLVPDLVATISNIWLTKTPLEFPERKTAAALALVLSKEIQAQLAEGFYFSDDEDDKAWDALLASLTELPDPAAKILLELCARREESADIAARRAKADEKHRLARQENEKKLTTEQRSLTTRILPPGPIIGPWVDGPLREIPQSIRNAILARKALIPLLAPRPELFKEILLAACIAGPHEENLYSSSSLDDVGVWERDADSDTIYSRGPFLEALRANSSVALDAIIKLVNFATDRWQTNESRRPKMKPSFLPRHGPDGPVQILIGEERRMFVGDLRLFGTSRNRLDVNDTLVSALMALEKWLYDELDSGRDIDSHLRLILSEGRSVAFLGVLSSVGKRKPDLLAGVLMPVLSAWQIFDWDNRMVMEWEKGAWRTDTAMDEMAGEPVFNEVRNWHNQPHRKYLLVLVAQHVFAGSAAVQSYFTSVRAMWDTLKGKDQEDDDSLTYLSARFDISNYRARKNGASGEYYFEWPESLRVAAEQTNLASQRGMQTIMFPMKCRQILDGKIQLHAVEVPAFWEEVQNYAVSKEDRKRVDRREVLVCAGLAVLMKFQMKWLQEDNSRWTWALEQVYGVVNAPPRDPFDSANEGGELSWEAFFAEIAMTLMTHDSNDPDFRYFAALSVMSVHYNATTVAIRGCRKSQSLLETDFASLVVVARIWSGIRRIIENDLNLRMTPNVAAQWIERTAERFVARTLPTRLSLRQIGDFTNKIMDKHFHRKYPKGERRRAFLRATEKRVRVDPGIDIEVLQACLTGMGELAPASSVVGQHQAELVFEWAESVISSLEEATPNNDEDIDGTPFTSDHWAFDNIWTLLAANNDTTRAIELSNRFFKLAPIAHYWVENFIESFFTHGQRFFPDSASFLRMWRKLIELAMEIPEWKYAAPRSAHLADMWIELMGLTYSNHVMQENQSHASYFLSLADLYNKWLDEWMGDRHVVRALAKFVVTLAGRPLLTDSVRRFSEAVKDFDEYDWGYREMSANLVRVCTAHWKWNQSTLHSDANAREAFLALLKSLAQRQEPTALQLRTEVASAFNKQ